MLKSVTLVAFFSLSVHCIAVAKPMALIGNSYQKAFYISLAQRMQGNIDRMFYKLSMKPTEVRTAVPSLIWFDNDPLSLSTMVAETATEDTVNVIFEPALAETSPNGEVTQRQSSKKRLMKSMRCFHHVPLSRD